MDIATRNTDQSLHRNNMQQKKPYARVYAKGFCLQNKPSCGGRDHSVSRLWGVSTGREYKRISWGIIKVLYLILMVIIFKKKNHQAKHLRVVPFTIRK